MNVKDNVKIANLDIPEGVVICEHDLESAYREDGRKIERNLNTKQ